MKNSIRKTVLWAGFILATMGNAQVAGADSLYFSSMGPITTGSTFSLSLLGDFNQLAGGIIDLGYDGTLLQINSVTVDPYWEFLPRNGSLTVTGTNSIWSGISFDTFIGVPQSGTAISIATISLTALAASNPELHILGTSETFDLIQQLSPTLGTAGISVTPAAVPVPPAVWLLASGLLGLVGIARRRTCSEK